MYSVLVEAVITYPQGRPFIASTIIMISVGRRRQRTVRRREAENFNRKKTPMMLMDEATAVLDASTSKAVTASILDIPELTKIAATHRLEP